MSNSGTTTLLSDVNSVAENHDIILQEPTRSASKKLVYLEAARGIASIFVIFWHFSAAFLPKTIFKSFLHGGIGLTPLQIVFNGPGAVRFFFVLSGFVLTLSLFRRPSLRSLLVSTIKRLPRLMIPCLASILIGYAMLSTGMNFYKDAALITHSQWLSDFGNAHFPTQNFTPSFFSAMKQGLFVFLTQDNFYYNSNLWTMRNEYFGSLIALMLAGLAVFGFASARRAVTASAMLILSILLYHHNEFYGQFALGTTLAYIYTQWGSNVKIQKYVSICLMGSAIIGFSTFNPKANTVASLLVIIILISNQRLASVLSGRMGYALGKMSFPIYLTHTLVIVSASSACYTTLYLHGINGPALLVSVLSVTLVVTVCLSMIFFFIEETWVPFLNRISLTTAVQVEKWISKSSRFLHDRN